MRTPSCARLTGGAVQPNGVLARRPPCGTPYGGARLLGAVHIVLELLPFPAVHCAHGTCSLLEGAKRWTGFCVVGRHSVCARRSAPRTPIGKRAGEPAPIGRADRTLRTRQRLLVIVWKESVDATALESSLPSGSCSRAAAPAARAPSLTKGGDRRNHGQAPKASITVHACPRLVSSRGVAHRREKGK